MAIIPVGTHVEVNIGGVEIPLVIKEYINKGKSVVCLFEYNVACYFVQSLESTTKGDYMSGIILPVNAIHNIK